jgi:hypothetical protein
MYSLTGECFLRDEFGDEGSLKVCVLVEVVIGSEGVLLRFKSSFILLSSFLNLFLDFLPFLTLLSSLSFLE